MGLGVLSGMVAGEILGDVDRDRVRRMVRRIRDKDSPVTVDTEHVERDILSALRGNPTTRRFDLTVQALGDGLVELTGSVQDERARAIARELAESIPGAEVVVNRILVEGVDTPGEAAASANGTP